MRLTEPGDYTWDDERKCWVASAEESARFAEWEKQTDDEKRASLARLCDAIWPNGPVKKDDDGQADTFGETTT